MVGRPTYDARDKGTYAQKRKRRMERMKQKANMTLIMGLS
jgi:hypothetical protein